MGKFEVLEVPEHVKFKLSVWRDLGDTEVTGFFITEKDEPLKVIDAVLVRAECTSVTVDIEPEGLEELYLEMQEEGIFTDQLMIWWHTHPGNSPQPSGTDEKTFEELGKDRTFNAMYILAMNGSDFAQRSITDMGTGQMIKENLTIECSGEPFEEDISFQELKDEYDRLITVKRFYTVYQGYTPYNYNASKFNKEKTSKETNQEIIDRIYKQKADFEPSNERSGVGMIAGVDYDEVTGAIFEPDSERESGFSVYGYGFEDTEEGQELLDDLSIDKDGFATAETLEDLGIDLAEFVFIGRISEQTAAFIAEREGLMNWSSANYIDMFDGTALDANVENVTDEVDSEDASKIIVSESDIAVSEKKIIEADDSGSDSDGIISKGKQLAIDIRRKLNDRTESRKTGTA